MRLGPLLVLLAGAGAWFAWRQAQAAQGHGAGAGDGSIFLPELLPVPAVKPAASVPAPLNAPRGIRNHNPGNIRRSGERWQGMAATQTDPAFVTFVAPAYGLRALGRVLLNYQRKHGLRSVAAIIGRWAPPSENDTGAYARAVAAELGQGVNDLLDLGARPELLPRLMRAIVGHENGRAWRDHYSAAQYDEGARLARAG